MATSLPPEIYTSPMVCKAQLLRLLSERATGEVQIVRAALTNAAIFRSEVLKYICILANAGETGFEPFKNMTPGEVMDLAASVNAGGGVQVADAFGEPLGTLLPLP